MDAEIRPMAMRDYDDVASLWEATESVAFDEDDTRDRIRAYLRRNPKMSFVARRRGRLIGAVLCGHDGRRGYLHHLAVAPTARRRGVGRALVAHCVDALRRRGIRKCNIFVFSGNEAGLAFWTRDGWQPWTGRCEVLSKRLSE